MEESDDTVTAAARRTRSGAAKTPKTASPATKSVKQKAGPLSKKTRKKVVVSDDEGDETVQEKKENDSAEETTKSAENKTEQAEKKTDELDKSEVEKIEVNGSGNNTDNKDIAEAEDVVLNDIVMLQDDSETIGEPQVIEKMEVDEVADTKDDKTKPASASEKSKEVTPQEVTPAKPKEVTPAKPKEVTPATPKEVAPAKPKEVTPAKPEEVTPAKPKEVTPATPKEVTPAKPKEVAPEKAEEIVAEAKTEKPKEVTLAKPEKPEEVLPETPKQATPAKPETSKEVTPEKPKEVAPEKPKQGTTAKSEIPKEVTSAKPEGKVAEVKTGETKTPVEKKITEKSTEATADETVKNTDKSKESRGEDEPEKKKLKLDEESVKKEQEVRTSEEKTGDTAVRVDTKITTETSEEKNEVAEQIKLETQSEKSDQEVTLQDEEKPEAKLNLEDEDKDEVKEKSQKASSEKQKADPDAENISEDELPTVQAVKVPEAEEVSDEELPGPKRAELPADTEVVSEDELPSVKIETKKESNKRKLFETDYDPGSPTSENEGPSKKLSLDLSPEREKEEKPKPKKLPELDKYWKAVNDDPTDFTGWTYLLQYVDQENDMEAAREAYDAFLSHYPYCYGYWRKYADYEKKKGNKKKCEEVFERGLKAIPLSVDLWIHYLTYAKSTRAEDEDFIRSQFERAMTACGLEFRSDRLWDSYIKWESEGKRLQKVTAIYDKLLSTPTQGYTSHFDNFQEHISSNAPNKVIDVDEFLALRKEVRQQLKHDVSTDAPPADSDAPPGDEDESKVVSSDEETKALRERIVSIRRKVHKNTVNAVTARWNYEEGIKRPYFHVKPLERCQLKNWQDYLDYETEQGDKVRIIVLFERCLIACALYEEFWSKFVQYLESLKDPEIETKIRDVYERACTIHHLKKPNLHLQWAMFEEGVDNASRAAEILVNLEKSLPNILQIAYRRINLERRRGDNEKCCQLYEHYINTSKNKVIASSISIKYSRFTFVVVKDVNKAQEILKSAITKDPNNPRLYLQLIDLTLQKEGVTEKEVMDVLDMFLDKEGTEPEQKLLFAQRKLEYLEDFGNSIKLVQEAQDQYQKLLKLSKDALKKKEAKSEPPVTLSKSSKETKVPPPSSAQPGAYGNYGPYGNTGNQQPPSYPPYSGNQQGPNYYPQYGQEGNQYQYQNWQYPQGGYGGYNQWGGYSGGYGY